MAYRPHGRAYADATSPRAWGICDRCGVLRNLSDLVFQRQYNGTQLYDTRLRVCYDRCLDIPQPQFLNPILGPDPMPVLNPRPPMYSVDEEGPTQSLLAQFLTSQTSITSFYIDLFDGNPSSGGESILQTLTGSATRTNFASSMSAPVAKVTRNTAEILFTSSALASVNVDWLAVYDAASAGTLLMSSPLLNPQTLVLYNGVSFPVGNLQVTLS